MIGWIKLHRKIKNWEWYDHIPTRLVFIHLLLSVNHEKKAWKGIEILPGQDVFSVSSLSKDTGYSIRQIRTVLSHLSKSGELNIESNLKYSIITINKWSDYQHLENEKITQKNDKQNDKQTTSKTTNKRQTNRQTNDKLQNSDTNDHSHLATNKRQAKRQTNDKPIDKQTTNKTTTPKEERKEEERKKEFIYNLNLNVDSDDFKNLDKEFSSIFIKYWTQEQPDGSMLFEKLPFFDFKKQIQLFSLNRDKFTKAKKLSHAKPTETANERSERSRRKLIESVVHSSEAYDTGNYNE